MRCKMCGTTKGKQNTTSTTKQTHGPGMWWKNTLTGSALDNAFTPFRIMNDRTETYELQIELCKRWIQPPGRYVPATWEK